ncbi:hypothetical protein BDA96_08G184500 [Sorghum bicolor]|uniref:Uncharacterized protein n=1 Tax=Sorghum bicolor TaxID=4558 RepID=A0A921U8I2_SORBI|nr:hypothetical protein BDA96_08G184500 [Sorghum bicolor]
MLAPSTIHLHHGHSDICSTRIGIGSNYAILNICISREDGA